MVGESKQPLLLSALVSLAAMSCIGPSIHSGSIECGETGLCPEGFECAVDGFCHRDAGKCGDGYLDPGETCDPGELCQVSCSDGNSCTRDVGLGAALTCNFRCVLSNVDACVDDDGCCPSSCSPTTDDDCSATCGNGTLEPGETCDPPQIACDTTCVDGDACTADSITGSPGNCNVACSFAPIVACVDDDGCCPAGCLNATDSDCSASCGNGVVEQGETCDPPSSCPQPGDCDDGVACTNDVYVGSAANCNAHCRYTKITECSSVSDRCCPAGCDFDSDPDCAVVASCGNGVIDPGETCDNSAPGYECPVACAVDDSCTIATLVGNSADCTAECVVANITECSAGDGCCPELCAASFAEQPALDLDCCSGSPCTAKFDP